MIPITVYKLNKALIKVTTKKIALFFPESESLTTAVLFLMNNTENTESSLYSFMGKYVLIVDRIPKNTVMKITEFCLFKTENQVKIESVKEYGKPIITSNAIMRYGVAFRKIKEIL